MTTPKPHETLRQLMQKHGLTQADVAELACVSRKTVASWLASPGSASRREMAPRHLRSVELALPSFLARQRAALLGS